MAALVDREFCSVAEEKFDFDISLSPASSKGDDEDENEVFLRPASQREKCLKNGVGSGLSQTEEPFEEISREAELLARQLATGLQDPKALEVSSANTNSQTEVMETFQTNLTAKQDLFSKPADVVLSPIKRETFCVQDSPMKQLPPAIQQRLMKAAGSVKSRISTSSPLRQTNAQPKVPLRGKAMLAKTRSTLPSKPTLPAPTKTAPAKAKTGLSDRSRFQLTVHKNPIRASSAEDLLSDSASVASDVSDSHLNTSLPVKRALQTGPRGPSSTKVPAVSGRRVVDRGRNTSSSSSSVSSINSSLSVSPTGKGKLNASLNSSGASMRAPSSVTKLPSSATSGQKQKQSLASRVPGATVGGRRSISAQGRRVSEAFLASTKSTPSKNPAPKPNPISACATPVRRTMERTISVPNMPANRSDSVAKGNPRLRALVIPTPLKHFKGTQPAEDAGTSPEAPRIMKPKRLAISCSLESLAPPTPSAGGTKLPTVQTKMRRPSALPTSVNRRMSGIPMLTPKTVRQRTPPSADLLRSSSKMAVGGSPCQVNGIQRPDPALVKEPCPPKSPSHFQPCSLMFSLEDEAERTMVAAPESLNDQTAPPNDPQTPIVPDMGTTDDHSQPGDSTRQEINEVLLLLEASVPEMKAEEKPLIDLSNTPDLIRTTPDNLCERPLIDLNSPLMKWTPDKKETTENDAPLINLSF